MLDFDYKMYSVNEYCTNAMSCFTDPDRRVKKLPVILGISSDVMYGLGACVQKVEGVYHAVARDDHMSIKFSDGNYLNYWKDKYNESLSCTNVGYNKKIKKDGTEYFIYKRYDFSDYTVLIDVQKNECKKTYKDHTIKTRNLKNGRFESTIEFRNSNCRLYEIYNSKGVCTTSLYFFRYKDRNESIQMHYKKKSKSVRLSSRISGGFNLRFLPDASIVNMYNNYHRFQLDVNWDDNYGHELLQAGLDSLKFELSKLLQESKYGLREVKYALKQIEKSEMDE